jgi:hypothetical protein
MPRENRSLLGFNRGLLSTLALARVDLPRTQLSASDMVNWVPRSLGAMMLRPGWGYIGNSLDDALAKYLPFVFSTDDVAHIEITEGALRVRIDDELVTRLAVSTAITNGTFTTNLASWTNNDEAGAASAWAAGGYMALLGTGTTAAIRDQQPTVAAADVNVQHALRIVVARGPVILRVGSTTGDDDYIEETTLGTGTHSLAFTPTGNLYIRLMNRRSFTALVDSVAIEAAGTMEVTAPWLAADLKYLRTQPSGDIIYVSCTGYQQRKIERRSTHSWSVVLSEPETGPFRVVNLSPITMTPSALSGDVQITASKSFFKSTNVGSLLRIQSVGQTVTKSISADNTFSDPIRVAGVGGQRSFGISISGTFVGTLTLQYSVSAPGNWVDVTSYTTTTSTSYDDGLDNQIIYYRIGIKTLGYTSGTAVATLSYTSGSIVGVARITAYSGPTLVNAVVLTDFGSLTASADWWEGQWSDRRGWPSAVRLHEARMGFGGLDRINLSISDSYEDFDDEFEGDAGPINRTIGEGPVETIPWMLSLNRLIVGTLASSANIEAVKVQGSNPLSGRSSSFDEPITPTNFNLKTCSATGVYVDPSLTRLFELKYDLNENDYLPDDLTVHVPDLNEVGIAGLAVQYRPDLRIWAWRTDGTVAVCLRDRAENITCWFELETDGTVEDVSVLPGTVEDRVYLSVLRDSSRFLEKVALESECQGGTLNKQADAFVTGTNSPASATISGLPYPDGTVLVVWADGRDLSPGEGDEQTTYTVASGAITLAETVTDWVTGIPYQARWKSQKLAFATALGSALNVRGKINALGLVLKNTHPLAIQYGANFDELDAMPLNEEDEDVDTDAIWEEYDKDKLGFDTDWSTDPRLCLAVSAPRPATVLCATVDLTKSG